MINRQTPFYRHRPPREFTFVVALALCFCLSSNVCLANDDDVDAQRNSAGQAADRVAGQGADQDAIKNAIEKAVDDLSLKNPDLNKNFAVLTHKRSA